MTLQRLTSVVLLLLVVGIVTLSVFPKSREWLANNSPALMQAAFKPSDFSIQARTVTCLFSLPRVTLDWSTSIRATEYLIQRQYPNGGLFEDVGTSNLEHFVDQTFESEYELGFFTYRVQAQGKSGTKYSPNIRVEIIDCAQFATTATTTLTLPLIDYFNTTVPTAASGAMQWGAFVEGDTSGLKSFERLVGKPVKIQAVFVGWGHGGDFPTLQAESLKASGKTLLIFWEPSNGKSDVVNQPSYNYDSIINGSWDGYLKTMAVSAKAYGAPVIMVPFEEMNGDWHPWSGTKNGNSAAKMIAAWRHVHDIFVAYGATNVTWGWAPNATSRPSTNDNDLTAYYPGDAYVDYVGADAFNFNDDGGWLTFGDIYNQALTKLEKYNKPIYLFSMATAEGSRKATWIIDAFAVQVPKHPLIKGWVWFNANKEKDWRVNSDRASLAAFKAILP